jgi:hypothetical protein
VERQRTAREEQSRARTRAPSLFPLSSIVCPLVSVRRRRAFHRSKHMAALSAAANSLLRRVCESRYACSSRPCAPRVIRAYDSLLRTIIIRDTHHAPAGLLADTWLCRHYLRSLSSSKTQARSSGAQLSDVCVVMRPCTIVLLTGAHDLLRTEWPLAAGNVCLAHRCCRSDVPISACDVGSSSEITQSMLSAVATVTAGFVKLLCSLLCGGSSVPSRARRRRGDVGMRPGSAPPMRAWRYASWLAQMLALQYRTAGAPSRFLAITSAA